MSSSLSLIIAGAGAVVAAVGSGVLLARSFRTPRPDLIAWSLALLGLLISLAAQTLGYLSGFDGAMFRAMELGGQVIAPLAVVLGMTEVAGKGLASRFCARVYLPALGIVAVVVLALDQLASTNFTKTWPNPEVYYQVPPDYVLMFAIGPVTALVALIAVFVGLKRSSTPGWGAAVPALFASGAAALLLAYPALVQLAKFAAHMGLPLRSEFSLCCAAAAALIFYAGIKADGLSLGKLHGRPRLDRGPGQVSKWEDDDAAGRRRDDFGVRDRMGARDGFVGRDTYGRAEVGARDGFGPRSDLDRRDGIGERGARDDWDERDPDRARGIDQTGDLDRFESAGDQGVYRGGGLYRDEHDQFDGGVATGDIDMSHGEDWAPPAGVDSRSRHPDRHDTGRARPGAVGGADDELSRADLFGQIAIYTLLEDRVDEFDRLSERVVEDVRSREPDTLVYIVHAVPSAPMQRILYEVYRNRAAFEWHKQQPYVTQFEVERRPYVLATNVIELGLQQAKVSPFPSVAELFGEPGYDTSGFERPDYLRDYGKPQASQASADRPDRPDRQARQERSWDEWTPNSR